MAEIKGATSLRNKLTRLKTIDITDIIEKATVMVYDQARRNTPVQTGELLHSIAYDMQEEKGKVRGVVYTNLEYGTYVEFGTGPKGAEDHKELSPHVHPRYSTKGWCYYDEKKGKWIWTRGQKAQPFLYPALHKNKKKIKAYIKKATKQKIKAIKIT